jgi:uncharacterized protein YndB with AHSA1/START domain
VSIGDKHPLRADPEVIMGRSHKTRTIDATPDQVFRAFVDPAIAADWMEADRIIDQHGSLDTAGSTFTLVISGPWRFRMRVLRSERPVVYAQEGRGPLGTSYRMSASLTPLGAGTRLVVDTEWTLPFGPVGRWMDRRWVQPGAAGEDDRELDRLVDIVTGREVDSPAIVVRGGRRARERAAALAQAAGPTADGDPSPR